MLKSMTGFGRCENATDEYKISVEMKAVNHRYLDLSIKMPKKFNYFEAAIRTLLKKYIQLHLKYPFSSIRSGIFAGSAQQCPSKKLRCSATVRAGCSFITGRSRSIQSAKQLILGMTLIPDSFPCWTRANISFDAFMEMP